MSKDIESYQSAYSSDYDFEREMVRARQKMLRHWLEGFGPVSVVEIGCGQEMLFSTLSDLDSVSNWIIIEPSKVFAQKASELTKKDDRIVVFNTFAEDGVDQVLSEIPGGAEAVICSGLLHEVPDPFLLLSSAASMCCNDGVVHINVPNAGSLHRQLARAMGLISNETQLSDRNKQLQQTRVYDADLLRKTVESANLHVFDEGGYFLKPFTHEQMRAVLSHLPEGITDGLWEIGCENPSIASEIYINARISRQE